MIKKASTEEIRDKAIEQGMKNLRFAGWKKVLDGVTTPEEIMRVTQIPE